MLMIYKKFTPCKTTIHGQCKDEVMHKTYALPFCPKMQVILHDFFSCCMTFVVYNYYACWYPV